MTSRNLMMWAILGAGAAGLCASASAYAGDTIYAYDALGRVIQVTYPNGTVIKYSYDSAGNRVSVSVTVASGSTWGSFNWGQGTW